MKIRLARFARIAAVGAVASIAAWGGSAGAVVVPTVSQNVSATNFMSGTLDYQAQLQVQTAPGTATLQNSAVAKDQCFMCDAIATSIQVVILTSPTATIANDYETALALQPSCNICGTFAIALQDVYTSPVPVFLTQLAKNQFDALRAELAGAATWAAQNSPNDIPAGILAVVQSVQNGIRNIFANCAPNTAPGACPQGTGNQQSFSPFAAPLQINTQGTKSDGGGVWVGI